MPPSADVQSQPSVIDSIKRTVAHVESVVAPSTTTKERTNSPADLAQAWCDSIQSAFDAKDVAGIERHFTDDGSWRDILVRRLALSLFRARAAHGTRLTPVSTCTDYRL